MEKGVQQSKERLTWWKYLEEVYGCFMLLGASMTRLGDLLHFGQLFKASGSNYYDQIAHVLGIFCKGVKIFHFFSGIIFVQLLQIFGDFLLVTLLGALW